MNNEEIDFKKIQEENTIKHTNKMEELIVRIKEENLTKPEDYDMWCAFQLIERRAKHANTQDAIDENDEKLNLSSDETGQDKPCNKWKYGRDEIKTSFYMSDMQNSFLSEIMFNKDKEAFDKKTQTAKEVNDFMDTIKYSLQDIGDLILTVSEDNPKESKLALNSLKHLIKFLSYIKTTKNLKNPMKTKFCND